MQQTTPNLVQSKTNPELKYRVDAGPQLPTVFSDCVYFICRKAEALALRFYWNLFVSFTQAFSGTKRILLFILTASSHHISPPLKSLSTQPWSPDAYVKLFTLLQPYITSGKRNCWCLILQFETDRHLHLHETTLNLAQLCTFVQRRTCVKNISFHTKDKRTEKMHYRMSVLVKTGILIKKSGNRAK